MMHAMHALARSRVTFLMYHTLRSLVDDLVGLVLRVRNHVRNSFNSSSIGEHWYKE